MRVKLVAHVSVRYYSPLIGQSTKSLPLIGQPALGWVYELATTRTPLYHCMNNYPEFNDWIMHCFSSRNWKNRTFLTYSGPDICLYFYTGPLIRPVPTKRSDLQFSRRNPFI